jgi:hypothetical protein
MKSKQICLLCAGLNAEHRCYSFKLFSNILRETALGICDDLSNWNLHQFP